jgi:hypothetical protein
MVSPRHVPDAPGGLRYCRECHAFIPVDRFYNGRRRYICKSHFSVKLAKIDKTIMDKSVTNDKPVMDVRRVWRYFWLDSKACFGQKKVGMTTNEVHQLFDRKNLIPGVEWRLVPLDPVGEWGVGNMTIVSKAARKSLVRVYSNEGVNSYKAMLNTVVAA